MPKRSKSTPPSPQLDPTWIIGEVLGEAASCMRNPVNAEHQCPFTNGVCKKRSHNLAGPMPVCSLYQNLAAGKEKSLDNLIAVCPKRFFEIELQNDVIEHCWFGPKPQNPISVYEIKMDGFGTVDMAIADINPSDNTVREFVSVELQAVDTTGSYSEAYIALTNHQTLQNRVSYNFNWSNVYKRYVMQLINKGFYHHHWKTHIVSVLQKPVFDRIREFTNFSPLPHGDPNINIVFLVYEYVLPNDPESTALATLKLREVVGTNHSSLMMGSMYKTPPAKDVFCERILSRSHSE